MSAILEDLGANFHRWVLRGNGTAIFDRPVSPAPPFVPFPGHRVPPVASADDGTRSNFFSRLADRLSSAVHPRPRCESPPLSNASEPEPNWRGEEEYSELQILLPNDFRSDPRDFESFVANVSHCKSPLVYEITGTCDDVTIQFSAETSDFPAVRRQLAAHFPDASLTPLRNRMQSAWMEIAAADSLIVELALAREFMLPLGRSDTDPLVGLMGALSDLGSGEAAVYQVLFSPLSEPWAASAYAAVTDGQGRPHVMLPPEMVKATVQKISQPLFGVIVRIAARASNFDRVVEILRGMASAFRVFSSPAGNELFPLANDNYPTAEHERDLLQRRSRRSGMIVNLDELIGFVHFPSQAIRSERFLRIDGNTRVATFDETPKDVLLGINEHAGTTREVWLSNEQRVRHMHLIGGTGTGKSTLLFNLIRQDIENGEGCAVLDPHGDLVDQVLGVIPPERIADVVLLDPSDEQFIVPFNILSAHSDFEKMLLASDLVSVFQRLSAAWGDQMNSVFRQAVLAFLESTEGGTLADLRRFLLDPSYRDRFLQTVTDADVRFYWKRGFSQLGGNKSIGPILTRLETLLSPKPLRLMLSQTENRLDFGDIMDSGKILLARLPQGQLGRENAFLFGSLVIAKIQQMAMSRQRMGAKERRPFFCYVDEFQNFITPSMAEILSSARKYRMGLILAHQELQQLEKDKEVSGAVLANAHTRTVFRVSDKDARSLSEGFAHFEPRDLQNLKVGEAICRIDRADNDFNLRVFPPTELDEEEVAARRAQVIEASRAKYAIPRADVDAMLLRKLEDEGAEHEKQSAKRKASAPSRPIFPEAVNTMVAEVGNEVVTESQQDAPREPIAEPLESTPAELGKGGYQHRIIQQRIKAVAEKHGFRVTLEMPLGAGRESVDVGLIRPDMRIACEVSVSTTIDHEVGNVRKCLREGFDVVAVITADGRRLGQIEAAVKGCLPIEERTRVQFFFPDQFIEYIASLPAPQVEAPSAPESTQTVRKGWVVKRSFKPLTPEERAAKEAATIRLIAEEMRLPRPPGQDDNKPT